MKSSLKFLCILFIIGLLTSCNKTLYEIKCYPKDATGCIGWAGNN